MATVLIVGGAGYVGSHTAKALAAAGHTGIVFDSLASGHRVFVRWGPLVDRSTKQSSMHFKTRRVSGVRPVARLRLEGRRLHGIWMCFIRFLCAAMRLCAIS